MRSTILGFSQPALVRTELELSDLVLLNYIIEENGNPYNDHIAESEISYVCLTYKMIQRDLPVLRMTETNLRNKICKLESAGFIDTITNNSECGTNTFYTVTEKTIDLLFDCI